MKRKPVPEPPATLVDVEDYRRALPLVPGSEGDCCRRLMERADAPDRSTSGEWLEFLCAIGLARETETGFVRTREDIDRAGLAESFRSGVVLADEVIEAVDDADEPLSMDDVFDRVRDGVPQWERMKRDDWQDFWRDQVERRLEWAVLLGFVEKQDGGYR